ncbi:hypothetical protein FFWV33_08380 [Flavobacterium faecale]|uniref:Response regulatory domain-containing protein n=1 Tax=Flavobacterium faecale TaxID=1355330 RepID=A0A2S1LCQ9_9FLAO|nr:response regulator [Flavobacterium faecale]AWG21545.1 hypothetical protein FFWV33_08380 [Flavobacterium faecale]
MIKKVLLIDDDPITNFVNSKIIKNLKLCELVDIKTSGQLALDYLYGLENDFPELILLDINMPIMSGFDFLEEYYKYGFNCNKSRIIMLTSSVFEFDKTKALQFDKVISFVSKPLTDEKVLSMYNLLT